MILTLALFAVLTIVHFLLFHRHVNRVRAEMDLPALPAPPPPGFNKSRRPDAVRRLRAGNSPESVALATGWSPSEIALLEKLLPLHGDVWR